MTILLTGCGNSMNCAILGNNVNGRINFGDRAPFGSQRTQLKVELSKDIFATVWQSQVVDNSQNLISVPYSLCADNNVNFTIRAFSDQNANGKWDAGEGTGRDDGTSDGNAAYVTRNIPYTAPADKNTSGDWKKINGVDIWIDEGATR